jgi:hypothetical protein
MAVLVGRREAHGHGLDPAVATELQRRLDNDVRHWTIALQHGGRRRNPEVVEGRGGIWRVRPAGELVELALVAAAARGDRTGPRPHEADRPESPSD